MVLRELVMKKVLFRCLTVLLRSIVRARRPLSQPRPILANPHGFRHRKRPNLDYPYLSHSMALLCPICRHASNALDIVWSMS